MVAQRGQSANADRGVSQVIGIVLLVGITVVLVGITAVYVTGFAEENQQPAPRFTAETEFGESHAGAGQYLNVTHDGGEPIDTETIYFKVSGARVWSGGTATGDVSYEGNIIEAQVGDEFVATDTVSLNRTAFVDGSGNDLTGSEYLDLTDATVRIVWETDHGSRTEIIYECSVGVPACEGE